ncbi:3-oxoacyl-synthase [Aspergillus campestris IBT 28561]|uniref:3-oxoacyl-synthase n=1 Tax=Aspergillus campestris (strain IBT 28561) TaxID=1392248 RepID=A0A2I1CS73_ASPC2|nr:3-oxoacyl-synthase [Aspergillus campestris IBT 28561]PKY00463.1 3-oxoacyl-synthase [Aspergillus campestris IBT 28561]
MRSILNFADPEDRKELAYRLFIEILSYQLASPVRWIETQTQLLHALPSIERFVEVGPRTTLATMAKRSSSKYYAAFAPSQWSQIQFLSSSDNSDEIFYRYTDADQSLKLSLTPAPQIQTIENSAGKCLSDTRPRIKALPPPSFQTEKAAPRVDMALSTAHVVLAMTAQKLRRPFYQVPMNKTIRDLSGGKSTLQNELVGDLVAEFGKVPEGAEDMPLATLSEALRHGASIKPGKAMSSLISRFISGKMPAGFNQNAVHDYLEARWGLTRSHSIIPICLATSVEPPTRLGTSELAKSYFDELVQRYSEFYNISLDMFDVDRDDTTRAKQVTVDSATFERLKGENKDFHRKHFEFLAQYLGIDHHPRGQQSDEILGVLEVQQKLDRWSDEFDEQFLHGIRPIFNPRQVRNYDSWWNWVREDLIRWILENWRKSTDGILYPVDSRLAMILNRWQSSCTDIISSYLDSSPSYLSRSPLQNCNIRPLLAEIRRLGDEGSSADPLFVYRQKPMGPKTSFTQSAKMEYTETCRPVGSYLDAVRLGRPSPIDQKFTTPFVHIKTRRKEEDWLYDPFATKNYQTDLQTGSSDGFSYKGKAVLVTGAGPDSIGAHIIQGLLSGGARVVVTTSREISASAGFYQQLYRQYGSKGASLTLLPTNQGSRKDCEALVEHLYGADSPVGGDIDYIIPFAAIPQTGELEGLDGQQELCLRTMLVNLLRLIGFVRREKETRRIETRPTMVILPMSCNEGTFGGDGLYAESKIGLRSLFNRFQSESWSTYVTVCGAVIGWTRGTGLMRSSNIVAEEIEKLGVMTFTQAEMAFNILALMRPAITTLADEAPIYADLTGGLGSMWDIKERISSARAKLNDKLRLQNALAEENARHEAVLYGAKHQGPKQETPPRLSNLSLAFPKIPGLKAFREIKANLPRLYGMVDLSSTIVVVGFSELGPWGNARTRWEMEYQGNFTLEGYVEMAWIMGLIRHVDGELEGSPYVGWIDVNTQSPVPDNEIPHKYHDRIMRHSGVRHIEPDTTYNPQRKEYLHEVVVEKDLPPFETSLSTAEDFKRRHGEHISLQPIEGTEFCRVYVKTGAIMMIPKVVPFEQVVAGTIPKGWDPARYGIPRDVVEQADVTTLYALCCVSEAFLSAGIVDPYEVYQYIHASELANCLGTGGGPLKIIQKMYRDRYLDRPVRGDIISEHFMNTMGAWINMLLLSAAGPLKTPVGACATAIESLDIGCEAIRSGNCKMAIVGGCDDYGEELAYEFANIKATANSTDELSKGRQPSEISRPTANSRSGFAESAGCGVQIITTASTALEMGLPIHGIIAYTQMASDQTGRSIPAPGKGILTSARESEGARNSLLLDFKLRRACFDDECKAMNSQLSNGESVEHVRDAVDHVRSLKFKDTQHRWANNIRLQDPSVSPMRAALATWGLTIDDIRVVSMHGTSTKANEINEGDVINTQMDHLGRRRGNPLLCVCQKSLTGHPKGAAGAWQLNGCMQMLRDSIIPGNRNADNIDGHLRRFEHLVYPMETMRVLQVDAAMLTSFGFGQKGAIAVVVAPRFIFASIADACYNDYRDKAVKRQRVATTEFISRIFNGQMVQVKEDPPWKNLEAMRATFLDSSIRLVDELDTINGGLVGEDNAEPPALSNQLQKMLQEVLQRPNASAPYEIGVDIEDISNVSIDNDSFLERNFTPAEREYCLNAPDPQSSFAGRWCAKEAVFKCMKTVSKGAGADMKDIEVLSHQGIPRVILHGRAKAVADVKKFSGIEVTISHSMYTAVAVAVSVGRV